MIQILAVNPTAKELEEARAMLASLATGVEKFEIVLNSETAVAEEAAPEAPAEAVAEAPVAEEAAEAPAEAVSDAPVAEEAEAPVAEDPAVEVSTEEEAPVRNNSRA